MYGQGIGIMDRVTTDLNQAKLEGIRVEAKIQSQVAGENVLLKIKDGLIRLFRGSSGSSQKKATYSHQRFYELDCQKSATPCS